MAEYGSGESLETIKTRVYQSCSSVWWRHRRLQARVIVWVILNHAYSYHEDWTQRHLYCICVPKHRRTYSIQCSDKKCFPQLCIKCSIAKCCPGTHTALQVPMGGG